MTSFILRDNYIGQAKIGTIELLSNIYMTHIRRKHYEIALECLSSGQKHPRVRITPDSTKCHIPATRLIWYHSRRNSTPFSLRLITGQTHPHGPLSLSTEEPEEHLLPARVYSWSKLCFHLTKDKNIKVKSKRVIQHKVLK